MGLTTFRQVLIAAMAGAVLAFFLLSMFDLFGRFPPMVPWSVPAVLAVMGLGSWIYSHGLVKRVAERRVSAQEAVRALVVAKSAIMTGAVLAGMHAIYIALSLRQLPAPAPLARVVVGGATVFASMVLVWGASRLEKSCVSPDGPADPDPDSDDGNV